MKRRVRTRDALPTAADRVAPDTPWTPPTRPEPSPEAVDRVAREIAAVRDWRPNPQAVEWYTQHPIGSAPLPLSDTGWAERNKYAGIGLSYSLFRIIGSIAFIIFVTYSCAG
jgi:hypothetical protein